MTQPGRWLRAASRRLFSADVIERVIDPAISDLQFEDGEAHRSGRPWRRVWLRIAGYTAFGRVVAVHLVHVIGTGIWQWIEADQYALGRTIGYSTALIAVLICLLALVPFNAVLRRFDVHPVAMLFFYLIPQAIPIAVMFGLPIGILIGLRERPRTRRIGWSIVGLAFIAAALTFFVCAWVLPEANQAFRTFVFHQIGRRGFPARGANELTFAELSRRITLLKTHGHLAEMRLLLWSYHTRLAVSAAPFIWGVFALGLSRTTRRAPLAIIASVVAAILYATFAWAVAAAPVITYPWLSPEWVCWLPNVLFALLTAALWVHARSGKQKLADV